ncbi:MAG: glycosyltransferase family 4 protein [Acidimicrobiia bacterium]
MRILHVGLPNLPVDSAIGGAVERRMRVLSQSQARLGHEVIVVTPERGEFSKIPRVEFSSDVELVRVRCPLGNYLGQIHLTGRAAWLARRRSCDVVHVHNAVAGGIWARMSARPLLLSLDFATYRFDQSLLRTFWAAQIGGFSRLLPVSSSAAELVRSKWPALPSEVLFNPVDETRFRPKDGAASSLDEPFHYGYLGRVCEQKGADILANAFRIVSATLGKEVKLSIAGPADRFGNIESNDYVEDLRRVGARVLGAISDTEVPSYLRSLDCLVVPTKRDERFGMVAAEAMACGTPIVSSGVGGLTEVVDTAAGINAEPHADAIAQAMIEMYVLRTQSEGRIDPRASSRRFWGRTVAEKSIIIYESAIGGSHERDLRHRGHA